jgi:hypothetical protein
MNRKKYKIRLMILLLSFFNPVLQCTYLQLLLLLLLFFFSSRRSSFPFLFHISNVYLPSCSSVTFFFEFYLTDLR